MDNRVTWTHTHCERCGGYACVETSEGLQCIFCRAPQLASSLESSAIERIAVALDRIANALEARPSRPQMDIKISRPSPFSIHQKVRIGARTGVVEAVHPERCAVFVKHDDTGGADWWPEAACAAR